MRTIYKYPLFPVFEQTIYVPLLKVDECDSIFVRDDGFGYEVHKPTALNIKKQILKLDVQNDIPCLWIMVDNDERAREIKVTLCGTGQQCHEPLEEYIDSVQVTQNSGINYVFHVFVRE